MKASDIKDFSDYCHTHHPEMKQKDFLSIKTTYQNLNKNGDLNTLEELFKTHLPEIYFDKDNLSKMLKVNHFLTNFCDKYCNGQINHDMFEKLIVHYNMTLQESRNIMGMFQIPLQQQGNIQLMLYKVLEKYINLRKRKLERILQ
jgi:hypothetical protein